MPRNRSSSGFTVKRAGYTPESVPENRKNLFRPKLTCTATRDREQSFTIRLTSEILLVGLIIRTVCPDFGKIIQPPFYFFSAAHTIQRQYHERERVNMWIKPNYETYRYTGEICRLQSQSIVECRLPGSEIGGILAVQAVATPTESACADGEVRYGGKLLVCVVYEDSNRQICRMERGAEFFHKAEHADVSPACFSKPDFSIVNVTHRREGSGVYVSVVVGADILVYGGKHADYLVGGEGICVQTRTETLAHSLCVSEETEGEDEFETDYVGDVLLHGETATVNAVRAVAGQVEIDGELQINACVLKADKQLRSYERIVPFTMQIPCEEAFGEVTVGARVRVKSARLTVGTDEENDKSRMVLAYALAADCFLHTKKELLVVDDVFSPTVKVQSTVVNEVGRYLTNYEKRVQRVSGSAHLSALPEGEYSLAAAIMPRAELTCKKTERGTEAEGVVTAEVLLHGAEGGYRAATLSLPFLFPLQSDGDETEAECSVCGLKVKRNGEETEAEATLKIGVYRYETRRWQYVSETTEGEEAEQPSAAVSVYPLREGETLWQVAKRLSRDPEELQKSNPDLTFPVKEGERIFVYRQIK